MPEPQVAVPCHCYYLSFSASHTTRIMTSAPTSKIEQYLDTKRQSLVRLSPRESYAESQQNKDTVVLIDIRPSSFRQAEGAIPGALIIERCAKGFPYLIVLVLVYAYV